MQQRHIGRLDGCNKLLPSFHEHTRFMSLACLDMQAVGTRAECIEIHQQGAIPLLGS
ncbi:hypothetical protein SDC9_124940 [bioreactor metagenome]|uniref:Uncharacterized protein n=1 Tax=bioreactor metagenome TaxID=1076179 RepID=A0A645CLM2_9ZZZZ